MTSRSPTEFLSLLTLTALGIAMAVAEVKPSMSTTNQMAQPANPPAIIPKQLANMIVLPSPTLSPQPQGQPAAGLPRPVFQPSRGRENQLAQGQLQSGFGPGGKPAPQQESVPNLQKFMEKFQAAQQAAEASVAKPGPLPYGGRGRPGPRTPLQGVQAGQGFRGVQGASAGQILPNQFPGQLNTNRNLPTAQPSLNVYDTNAGNLPAAFQTVNGSSLLNPKATLRPGGQLSAQQTLSAQGNGIPRQLKKEDVRQHPSQERPPERVKYVMISICLVVGGFGVLVLIVLGIVNKRRRRRYDRCRGISDDCELRSNFQLVNEDERLGIRKSSTYFM